MKNGQFMIMLAENGLVQANTIRNRLQTKTPTWCLMGLRECDPILVTINRYIIGDIFCHQLVFTHHLGEKKSDQH